MPKIQIDKSFLGGVDLLLYLLKDYELDETTKTVCQALQQEVDKKFTAIERREAFTAYKTSAADTAEREKFRQEYLDMIGMHKDWRTKKETPIP